jgi:hypothetical protein
MGLSRMALDLEFDRAASLGDSRRGIGSPLVHRCLTRVLSLLAYPKSSYLMEWIPVPLSEKPLHREISEVAEAIIEISDTPGAERPEVERP